jgi:hypothetical protein
MCQILAPCAKESTTMFSPQPIIILLPEANIRWIGGSKKLPAKKPRNPHRPPQPIPTFNRRALRERVARFLEQNKIQREQLRAAAWT